MLDSITIRDLRGYAALDASFGPGPHLIAGPNAAGKTSLLEAIVLLAWGRSHRTSTDGEIVRWGDRARPGRGTSPGRETHRGRARPGRSRRREAGGGAQADPGERRAAAGGRARRPPPGRRVRAGGDAPRRRLARAASGGDRPARRASGSAYLRDLATYGRTLQQRNSLLRAIREEQARPRRAPVLGRDVPRCRRRDRGSAAAAARRPGRAARPGPRGDRAGGGGRQPAGDPVRDERAGTPR